MSKKAVVKGLMERLDVPESKAGSMYDAMMETITQELKGGAEVSLAGVGKLKVVRSPAQNRRNPRTGEMFTSQEKKKVRFKMYEALKVLVNE